MSVSPRPFIPCLKHGRAALEKMMSKRETEISSEVVLVKAVPTIQDAVNLAVALGGPVTLYVDGVHAGSQMTNFAVRTDKFVPAEPGPFRAGPAVAPTSKGSVPSRRKPAPPVRKRSEGEGSKSSSKHRPKASRTKTPAPRVSRSGPRRSLKSGARGSSR